MTKLTSREQEILDLLLIGITPKDIANKLSISYHTVDFYRTKLYQKLGVHNIQELMAKHGGTVNSGETANSIKSDVSSNNRNFFSQVRFKMLILAGILIVAASILFVWYFFLKPSASIYSVSLASVENPFVITLGDNEPWGYFMSINPFSNKKVRITEGDNYTLSFSFSANIDIELLYVYFADINYNRLSSNSHLKGSIQANNEYNGLVTIIVNKTASSKEPNANHLIICTFPYTNEQPTITFTRLELIKN